MDSFYSLININLIFKESSSIEDSLDFLNSLAESLNNSFIVENKNPLSEKYNKIKIPLSKYIFKYFVY